MSFLAFLHGCPLAGHYYISHQDRESLWNTKIESLWNTKQQKTWKGCQNSKIGGITWEHKQWFLRVTLKHTDEGGLRNGMKGFMGWGGGGWRVGTYKGWGGGN